MANGNQLINQSNPEQLDLQTILGRSISQAGRQVKHGGIPLLKGLLGLHPEQGDQGRQPLGAAVIEGLLEGRLADRPVCVLDSYAG